MRKFQDKEYICIAQGRGAVDRRSPMTMKMTPRATWALGNEKC